MADDADDEEEQGPKGSSPIMAIVFLLVAGLLAGGTGFAAGSMMFAPMIEAGADTTMPDAAPDEMAKSDAKDGQGKDAKDDTADEAPIRGLDYNKLTVVELDPITTNIAVPSEVWVRMELSLAVDPGEEGEEPDAAMLEAIQADLLAYLRTTRLQSLSMPSGFQHLVSDLESRAAIRSDGAVKRVFVRALLLE